MGDKDAQEGGFLESIRETTSRLRAAVLQEDELLELLAAPLAACNLLPTAFQHYHTRPYPSACDLVRPRWVPALQSVLLQHVVPHWYQPLKDEGHVAILEQFFCPVDVDSEISPVFSSNAYMLLSASSVDEFGTIILARLLMVHPLHELFLSSTRNQRVSVGDVEWEALSQAYVSVSTRVANSNLYVKEELPPILLDREFRKHLYGEFELIVYCLSKISDSSGTSRALHLLRKLVQTGAFPVHNDMRQSFFSCCIHTIRDRLLEDRNGNYSATWSSLACSLPVTAMQPVLTSLILCLPSDIPGLATDGTTRSRIKRHAQLLESIFGSIRTEPHELWVVLESVFLGRSWDERIARVLVCWTSKALDTGVIHEQNIINLMHKTLLVWTSTPHVQNLMVSRHRYITCILFLCLSHLPRSSNYLQELATSPPFLSSISKYIGHLDPAIRRLGMAFAEYLADVSGRQLRFGDWDGDKDCRDWIRHLRLLVQSPDVLVSHQEDTVDTIAQSRTPPLGELPATKLKLTSQVVVKAVDSDDESIIGYDSSHSSSRPPSPTPSDLEEIEKDPTLRVGGGLNKQKIVRPIYLANLGELLRPSKAQEEDQFQKLQIALTHGEELIRRKKDYGTELEENAANLAHAFIGLQDNYDMDHFEARREKILIALVACCPRIAAPCITEQFFHNQYSTTQRFSMLAALALGARELAGLTTPPPVSRKLFPSKMLLGSLHERYQVEEPSRESWETRISSLADSISEMALRRGREDAEEKVPQIIRQKQLRLRMNAPRLVREAAQEQQHSIVTTFTEVAAEYFIMPFITRFWQYLRDEQVRESRSHRGFGQHRYRGAGTGMILDALVLRQVLSTLALLVHAARHSVAFLPLLSPEALELAVAIGTRPVSLVPRSGATASTETDPDDDFDQQAFVVAAALELALVILDAAKDLDSGRELTLEKTPLLLAVREWAGDILRSLEARGSMDMDGYSNHTLNRVRRAAAGVTLRLEEMLERWGRSISWLMQ